MKKLLFICFMTVSISFKMMAGPEAAGKHIVKKGETLYSISRSCGVKVADLVKLNPGLSTKSNLRLGQQLRVPGNSVTNSSTAQIASRNTTKTANRKPVAVPSTPDTPYKEEDDRSRTNAVEPTKEVASINSEEVVASKREVAQPAPAFTLRTSSSNVSDYPRIFDQYSEHRFELKQSKGTASFISESTSGNPYLALYNDAETGSIIRVTSLMNHKTVYAKVVGRVPSSDTSKEIMLKLSQKVADELGATDSRFLVEVDGFTNN